MPISRRVAKALAELGEALKEEGFASSGEEWEKISVGSPKGPGPSTAAPANQGYSQKNLAVCTGEVALEKPQGSQKQLPVAPAVSGRATGSHVAYHEDIRCYIVLENPNDQTSLGFWQGPAPHTWRRIERTLKNGELWGSKARLRRVQTRQEAEELWQTVHPGRKMPVVCEC